MTLRISDDHMTLDIANASIADATRQADGRWQVSTWPEPVDRNQAITALTIIELLEDGYPGGHPLVVALSAELA
jgi:hypothetical protein